MSRRSTGFYFVLYCISCLPISSYPMYRQGQLDKGKAGIGEEILLRRIKKIARFDYVEWWNSSADQRQRTAGNISVPLAGPCNAYGVHDID